MPSLDQMKAVTTHRVLVYGDSKTGKTELVGKLAEHFNLLWLDSEQGWSTLLKLPAPWQKRIRVISIPDSRVFPIAAETWLKVIKGGPITLCNNHGKVNCMLCKKETDPWEQFDLHNLADPGNGLPWVVVFDSLTQLTNSFIAHITKSQPDDYKLQLDDWGYLRVLMDKFLSQVQAARYNVACITHAEYLPLEDGKTKMVPVAGSSKSSIYAAKYFDHVVYSEVKNKKHCFGSATDYAANIISGSRSGVRLETSPEPTLLDIFLNKIPSTATQEANHAKNLLTQSAAAATTPVGKL